MFEAVHGGEFIEGGLHHPNQYYEQSRKVLNPKTFEDSDGKEEQAEPTSPQQKEIAIDVGVVGVLILAPTFLRVDVPAGKVARREVKRVSSPHCVHMRALRLDFYSRIDSDLRAFASLFSFCFCTSNAPKMSK